MLNIEYLAIDALKPYEKNARKHEEKDISAIIASIREFGFDDPVGIWSDDNLIVEGHGRVMAAKRLGMTEVPCIRLDHLTDEQRRAYALAHNRTAELSDWDFVVRDDELQGITEIDMEQFGFLPDDWFATRERNDTSREDGNEEYNEFLDKFEPKKTTDDCYTPDIVYNAVAEWVAKEYALDKKNFVRPFYPGGDFKRFKYSPGAVVVDNPPFSILSEILTWYTENGVPFFLFAPALTLFSSSSSVCALPCGVGITYENGACVNTSFLTNLENHRVRVAPELYQAVEAANTENIQQGKKVLPKYKYPDEVLTAAMCNYMCAHGVALTISREESYHTRQLDSQKEADGQTIFGSGYLLSEKAAAEKAAATVWELSDRERKIIRGLGRE